jgi:hypothetical protein
MLQFHRAQFDRVQRPPERSPWPPTDDENDGKGDGPRAPRVDKPNTDKIMKRLLDVDKRQAEKYRQRTGE